MNPRAHSILWPVLLCEVPLDGIMLCGKTIFHFWIHCRETDSPLYFFHSSLSSFSLFFDAVISRVASVNLSIPLSSVFLFWDEVKGLVQIIGLICSKKRDEVVFVSCSRELGQKHKYFSFQDKLQYTHTLTHARTHTHTCIPNTVWLTDFF